MKVEVNETEKKTKFPCFMKYNDNTNIIILVTGIDGCHAVGISVKDWHYSKNWTTYNLVPFNGSITLSND